MRGRGKSVTSPNTHAPLERRKKRIAPKQTKKAERTIVFKKNQKVPLTTPETLSQSVIGVTKKSISADDFASHKSVPLLSTSQFQKNTVLVISGYTNVSS